MIITIIGNIVISIIALISAIICALIKKNTDLTAYRITNIEANIEKIEKKVDKQDELEKEIAILKEKIKVANHRLDDLEVTK